MKRVLYNRRNVRVRSGNPDMFQIGDSRGSPLRGGLSSLLFRFSEQVIQVLLRESNGSSQAMVFDLSFLNHLVKF